MDSGDDHAQPSPAGDLRLRQYVIRAAKAYLCVVCWAGIVAALLIYGPPAMSVPTISGTLHAGEAVDAAFGILLSAGTGTFLTIVLILGILAHVDGYHSQDTEEQDQSDSDATGSVEDETHA
jgi:hypothetical protein